MIEKTVQSGFNAALDFLKDGEFQKAYSMLQEVLQDDLANTAILYALKGIAFWMDKLDNLRQIKNPFEQGEYMISQWKPFLVYMRKQEENREIVIYALKRAVFNTAIKCYYEIFDEDPQHKDSSIYRRIGLCYKALGDYENGLEFLKYAYDLDKSSSAVIAELADCYALYGETAYAKVFFREAFFIDPDGVELQFLESELICRLIQKLQNLGLRGNLADWIPVYGVLDGIFNVKRELRSFELGQLKQNIVLLEREFQEKGKEQNSKIVPRLLNHYFWLIDHYINTNEDKSKIDKIILSIKVLDKNIYNSYIK